VGKGTDFGLVVVEGTTSPKSVPLPPAHQDTNVFPVWNLDNATSCATLFVD